MHDCIQCGAYTKYPGGKCFNCYKKSPESKTLNTDPVPDPVLLVLRGWQQPHNDCFHQTKKQIMKGFATLFLTLLASVCFSQIANLPLTYYGTTCSGEVVTCEGKLHAASTQTINASGYHSTGHLSLEVKGTTADGKKMICTSQQNIVLTIDDVISGHLVTVTRWQTAKGHGTISWKLIGVYDGPEVVWRIEEATFNCD